jgi:hypothetical protein
MPNYLNAASNTQVVASKVVEFIRLNNLNPQILHCIGKIILKNKIFLYDFRAIYSLIGHSLG